MKVSSTAAQGGNLEFKTTLMDSWTPNLLNFVFLLSCSEKVTHEFKLLFLFSFPCCTLYSNSVVTAGRSQTALPCIFSKTLSHFFLQSNFVPCDRYWKERVSSGHFLLPHLPDCRANQRLSLTCGYSLSAPILLFTLSQKWCQTATFLQLSDITFHKATKYCLFLPSPSNCLQGWLPLSKLQQKIWSQEDVAEAGLTDSGTKIYLLLPLL